MGFGAGGRAVRFNAKARAGVCPAAGRLPAAAGSNDLRQSAVSQKESGIRRDAVRDDARARPRRAAGRL